MRQHFRIKEQSRNNGGDEESRTPDPLLARQVLSQLSYTPTCFLLFYGPPQIARFVELRSNDETGMLLTLVAKLPC